MASIREAHEILKEWDVILSEEEIRRRIAPRLAAEGKLYTSLDEVRRAGFRQVGVCLGVYGAIIDSWVRNGHDKIHGMLRAYTAGRGPDPILNVEKCYSAGEAVLYFEVNQNGKLNFKVGGEMLAGPRWLAILEAVKGVSCSPGPSALRHTPRAAQSNTVCSWDIGLWQKANQPEFIAGEIARILAAYVPAISPLCGTPN